MGELERVLSALDAAGVRYLVVGGVAVVLHGHPRMTADLDLVLELAPENVRAAFAAPPFDFEMARARALVADLGGLRIPVASIEDLVAMKRRAGRPKDLEDMRVLRALAAERGDRGDG